MMARGMRLPDKVRAHPSFTRIATHIAVDTTVKTYRGTRAKKGAIAIKQLPYKTSNMRSNNITNDNVGTAVSRCNEVMMGSPKV